MSLDLFAILPITKLGEVECYCTPRNICDLSVWSDGAIHLGNVTHNLAEMARHIDVAESLTLYDVVWCSEQYFDGIIDKLRPLWILGYNKAKADESLKDYNPKYGFGNYETFLAFLDRIITDSEPLLGIGVKCESDR